MHRGWLCIWRKIEDNVSWSRGIEYRGLIITLLRGANWKPGFFMGRKINPGQLATSTIALGDDLGTSKSKCHRMLRVLESDGLIKIENVGNRFSIISILNWDTYQGKDAMRETPVGNQRETDGKPMGSQWDTGETQVGTIKQSNKVTREQGNNNNTPQPPSGGQGDKSPEEPPEKPKKPRKKFQPPTVEEVAAYCQERNNRVDPGRFVDHYTANGWMVGKNKMKDWQASVRTWEKNDNQRGRNNAGFKKTGFDGSYHPPSSAGEPNELF